MNGAISIYAVSRAQVTFTAPGLRTVWMPAETVVDLYVTAASSDRAMASWEGFTFGRDDLGAVVSRLVEEFPCNNTAHGLSGADYPGLHDMGRGAFFCRNCCAACDDGPVE